MGGDRGGRRWAAGAARLRRLDPPERGAECSGRAAFAEVVGAVGGRGLWISCLSRTSARHRAYPPKGT